LQQYAARRGIEIIRTYADEGKSGLRLDGRNALQQLIESRKFSELAAIRINTSRGPGRGSSTSRMTMPSKSPNLSTK
jgi:hypothetical protein